MTLRRTRPECPDFETKLTLNLSPRHIPGTLEEEVGAEDHPSEMHGRNSPMWTRTHSAYPIGPPWTVR